MTRAEKVAIAQQLRSEGWKLREIAEHMGYAAQTVDTWLCDPDLSKQRARRRLYSKPCENCGRPTDGSGGFAHQRKLCQQCNETRPHSLEEARAHFKRCGNIYTDEEMLDALREAHAAGISTVTQYRKSGLRPTVGSYMTRFGSWNAAREAAGLPTQKSHRPSYTRLSNADLAQAVASVWDALGQPPSRRVYDGYRQSERPDLPCSSLIRKRFGQSWVSALEAAAAMRDEAVAA